MAIKRKSDIFLLIQERKKQKEISQENEEEGLAIAAKWKDFEQEVSKKLEDILEKEPKLLRKELEDNTKAIKTCWPLFLKSQETYLQELTGLSNKDIELKKKLQILENAAKIHFSEAFDVLSAL